MPGANAEVGELLGDAALFPWSNTPELKRSAIDRNGRRASPPYCRLSVPTGGLEPHPGTGGGGVGDVRDARVQTGLAVEFARSGRDRAAAPGFVADNSRDFVSAVRAFSRSILARRRHHVFELRNCRATKRISDCGTAVPESSCYRMATYPKPTRFNFRANQPYGHHIRNIAMPRGNEL